MTSSVIQAKAVILICLLGGQEIHSMRAYVAAQEEVSLMDDAVLQEDFHHPEMSIQKKLNSKCSWKGICIGEGCKLRPLPLDKGPSDSCRLSTVHMVNSPPEKFEEYIGLTTDLLKQKTASFQADCINGGRSIRMSAVCKRRIGEIFQANTFLQAANQKLEHLPADQYVEARSKINTTTREAGKQLSDLFGDDATLVLGFLQQVQRHPTLLGDNLRDVTLYTMKTIGALLDGTEEEKEKARADISELLGKLPSGNAFPDESAKIEEIFKGMGLNHSDYDWSIVEDQISEVTKATTETSSLLDVQEWSQGCHKALRALLWLIVFGVLFYTVIFSAIMLFDVFFGGPIWRWTRCKKNKEKDIGDRPAVNASEGFEGN